MRNSLLSFAAAAATSLGLQGCASSRDAADLPQIADVQTGQQKPDYESWFSVSGAGYCKPYGVMVNLQNQVVSTCIECLYVKYNEEPDFLRAGADDPAIIYWRSYTVRDLGPEGRPLAPGEEDMIVTKYPASYQMDRDAFYDVYFSVFNAGPEGMLKNFEDVVRNWNQSLQSDYIFLMDFGLRMNRPEAFSDGQIEQAWKMLSLSIAEQRILPAHADPDASSQERRDMRAILQERRALESAYPDAASRLAFMQAHFQEHEYAFTRPELIGQEYLTGLRARNAAQAALDDLRLYVQTRKLEFLPGLNPEISP